MRMSTRMLKKVRGRWLAGSVCVAVGAAVAGLGLAAPAQALPPEVIIADTFATRTVTAATPAIFEFDLPAGHWTAEATLTARNNTGAATDLACTLLIISENSTNNTRVFATVGPNGQLASLATGTARTVATSGVVVLRCVATTNMSVSNVNIMATRANSLTRVDLG
jgi:hypothetical protein